MSGSRKGLSASSVKLLSVVAVFCVNCAVAGMASKRGRAQAETHNALFSSVLDNVPPSIVLCAPPSALSFAIPLPKLLKKVHRIHCGNIQNRMKNQTYRRLMLNE